MKLLMKWCVENLTIRYMIIAIFIAIALTIVLSGHYLVYYSLINFLSITNGHTKNILAAVLFILPLSFFISSLLAHWQENLFTRILYFISSLWLGIFFLIFVFVIDIWILNGITKLVGLNLNLTYICIIMLTSVAALTIYSFWNVSHPIIKTITVQIPNLPAGWENKTAVQLSDLHIGHILQERFLKNITDQIAGINPDIIFITGDLLDGMDGDLRLSLQPLSALKPPLGKYFVTGNHETYFGTERATKLVRDTDTKLLNDEMVTIEGIQIVGVSYPERGVQKNIAQAIQNITGFNSSTPTILLYHDPVQVESNKNIGVNLQLSGHTHAGQIWPMNYMTRLVYGRYYRGLNMLDNFSIYTSPGTGVWGPTMRLGSRSEITVIKFKTK